MKQLLFSNPMYQRMDNESVAAINALIGTAIPLNKTEGVTNMCKAWDDLMNEGREEGRIKGREEGRIKMIADFLLNGGTQEQAKTMLKASDAEIEAACGMLPANVN